MSDFTEQNQHPRHASVARLVGMNLDGASDGAGGASQRGSSQRGGSQASQRGNVGGSSSRGTGSQAGGSMRGSPPQGVAKSRSGSTTGNTGGSQAPGSVGPAQFGKGLGFDPAIDPNDPKSSRPVQLSETELVGKRIDLPADAFKSTACSTPFTKRPAFNSEGKPIKVQLNIFPVQELSAGDIYQYDVNVSPNPRDSRPLVRKVWESQAVQTWLRNSGMRWLCDGHRLAWSSRPIPNNEKRITIDLDAEAGKTQVGRNGVYHIQIRQCAKIRMEALKSYINGKMEWDNHVLQCMNFLDHLMRQWPSETMQAIKRNFYPRDGPEVRLDSIIGLRKGTYSAFRLSETSLGSMRNGICLNVDVANTAFWLFNNQISTVARILVSPPLTRNKEGLLPMGRVAELLRPKRVVDNKSGAEHWIHSDDFKKLRRLARLKFTVVHRGKAAHPKIYTIKRVLFHEKYGAKGADALHVTFDKKNSDGSVTPNVRIIDYYFEKYGGRLSFPDLPLLETSRDGLFPMEVCKLLEFQRYTYKLDPEQTAQMIKNAVTRPNQRKADIMSGVRALKWNEDPYLKEFGVKIHTEMIISNARLLQNPEVHFGGGQKINPNMQGRWDLRGKKFIEPNPKVLASWGFIGCGTNDHFSVQKDSLSAFAQNFARIYKGHGGKIAKNPYIQVYPFDMGYPDMCTHGYNDTFKACGSVPQILFFIVSTRNMIIYERLKKNMDCRFCTVSQFLLADHVRKNSDQYCSNVAMKVNAKLGGITCKAAPIGARPNHSYLPVPTIFLGMDVSHASPGTDAPSMAALTMSTDRNAAKYCANVQTNGWRREIVNGVTMHYLFDRLLKYWVKLNGCTPKHIYYFRDGVAEGQFAHILEQEIKELKRIFRDAQMDIPRFTVLVATKRHHIRFFPRPGDNSSADKNANPLPGTLVEHDATHPYHWDFYLSSHVAIQGTARPVHYQVILDEANLKPNDIQRMLYHHCYQYARSTTPVSLHPAVYYSHLASLRARAHEDVAASNREVPSGKAGFPLGNSPSSVYSGPVPTEAPLLIPMENGTANPQNVQHINTTMWYI